MDDNMTLLIDPETRDLVFDDDGCFKKIYGDDTTVQNVRHTLLTWKGEFFADEEHGTDYEQIVGVNENEIEEDDVEEIIRDAVLQEPDVSRVEEMTADYNGRSISTGFTAVLEDGETMSLEVTV